MTNPKENPNNMDPNTTLTEIRRLQAIRDKRNLDPVEAYELADAIEALDEWLTRGGFLPDAWRKLTPDVGVNPALDQMLHDIFVTAMESGIDYWSDATVYHWGDDGIDDVADFHATVRDREDGNAYEINRATISVGMDRLANGGIEVRSDFADQIQRALANPEDSDIDANMADCIVQAGVFGDIRYS